MMENVNTIDKVNANEVVVKEEMEMTMENQNVQAQVVDEHAGKVRRFCNHCGKEMWVEPSSRQSICNECRELRKAENARVAHEKAQARKDRENLVTMNVTMRAEVKEALKNGAKEKGLSVADFLKELLGVVIEEKQEEKEIA